jgi:integrase
MTAPIPKLLPVLSPSQAPTRTVGDRLELLQALMTAPSFDPMFREDVIRIPGDHPAYHWECTVPGCKSVQYNKTDRCFHHEKLWRQFKADGKSITDFLDIAEPVAPKAWPEPPPCLICPEVPATTASQLCYLHGQRWLALQRYHRPKGTEVDFMVWLAAQAPFPTFGKCLVSPCPETADNPLRLCRRHTTLYKRQGSPGGASPAKRSRWRDTATAPDPVAVSYEDKRAFDRWCREGQVINYINGKISLLGLRPLVRAEIQWSLFHHCARSAEGMRWHLAGLQHLARDCRTQAVNSLADLDLARLSHSPRLVASIMLRYLRLIYFCREDTKDAGFIEMEHFGVQLRQSTGHLDLTRISQRWLRDLVWEDFAARLLVDPPRSRNLFDNRRRGVMELSAFLEAQAPEGGHDPRLLTKTHMVDFVADQRHRAAHKLSSLITPELTPRGNPRNLTVITDCVLGNNFNGIRRVLRGALESGETDKIGLDRAFIVVLPAGKVPHRRRNPFPDSVARALANEANLDELDRRDIDNRGLRDAWVALVLTGRRCREVLELRLECIGRINDLPLLWHDQTKVGNLEEGIRIPEWLYKRIEARQEITIARFHQLHGRPPTPKERLQIALFPRRPSNRSMHKSISYTYFHGHFRDWMNSLDVAHGVPHQARHTLATNLLRAGAELSHIKRYLGQVSEAMAEHYAHIANTDPRLNAALNTIWVAGPGSAEPGRLLSGDEPLARQQAEALAIDLTRRSTPADGGFCTFQPVVNGEACPWNLDCHNCDKFVLSGADLVYWHRKREQWRLLAEGAPDSATADYLHDYFEPTARAITGLERALEALGLLDDALQLDLRRPQDYFGQVWSTAFRAQDLARHQELDDLESAS